MAEQLTVASAILTLLGQHGVRRAFGIPGVHNLAYWDADGANLPRIIGVRHEQAAGYAADGLHRATGELGIALLTSGPGVANVVTAFGEAHVSGSPVLLLASEVNHALRSPGGPRGILHEMADQGGLIEAFGAPARRARTRQEAMASVVLALRDAWGPPPLGSYVGIPTDVLGEPWTAAIPHIPRLPSAPVDAHDVTAVAEVIRACHRPVIWAGGGVVTAGAEDLLRTLAHRLGAPVITSYAGRGLLAGDPLRVDAPVHEPEVSALLEDADLLLVLGSSFDGMNTKNWRLPLPSTRVAITLGSLITETIHWDHLIHGDLARRGRGGRSDPLDRRAGDAHVDPVASGVRFTNGGRCRVRRAGRSSMAPGRCRGVRHGRRGLLVRRLQLATAAATAAVPRGLGHPRLRAPSGDRSGICRNPDPGRLR